MGKAELQATVRWGLQHPAGLHTGLGRGARRAATGPFRFRARAGGGNRPVRKRTQHPESHRETISPSVTSSPRSLSKGLFDNGSCTSSRRRRSCRRRAWEGRSERGPSIRNATPSKRRRGWAPLMYPPYGALPYPGGICHPPSFRSFVDRCLRVQRGSCGAFGWAEEESFVRAENQSCEASLRRRGPACRS